MNAADAGRARFRPVDEPDLAMLIDLSHLPDLTGEFAQFGWLDPGRYRRRWKDTGLLDDDGGVLIVTVDDRPAGFVIWRRRQRTPTGAGWSIGIALLPAFRGRGHGTEAQRQLVDYLFAHTPAHRIEADTELGNLAEQRALERAGFQREGVLRAAGWRDGAWRDAVTYSVLRCEYTERGSATAYAEATTRRCCAPSLDA